MSLPVGIEKMAVYPCSLMLPMADLCRARGRDAADITETMMIDARSLNPLWEDPVTMAVNAANAVLTDDDRDRVELLIVATESALDYEKPLSTWVQRFAGLKANCRNFEIKHACYGGMASLQMASHWLASGHARGAKALLVTTDQSRTHLKQPWEFVLGAGATAVLLSNEPSMIEFDLTRNGYWTQEVSDLIRPTSTVETGNSETSLVSYIEALEGAFAHFVSRVPEAARYDETFSRHVYHMPFGGIAWRAHKTLLRFSTHVSTKEAWANFERKGLAALHYVRQMGGTYSSSIFLGMLGMLAQGHDVRPGERLSVFSYGSGCCSEFMATTVGPEGPARARALDADRLLRARRVVSIDEYEALELQRPAWADAPRYDVPTSGLDGWYDTHYRGKHLLTFRGVSDFYRQYAWS